MPPPTMNLATADSGTLRDEMLAGLVRMILGPMDPAEKIPSNPSDTYLTGVLWPRGEEMSVLDDDAAAAESGGGDSGAPEEAVPGYRARKPCSIGLTFATRREATVSISLGDTARYVRELAGEGLHQIASLKAVPEMALDKREGKSAKKVPTAAATLANPSSEGTDEPSDQGKYLWRRVALAGSITIGPDEKRAHWSLQFPLESSGSNVRIDIKRRDASDRLVFTVTLVNDAPETVRGVPNDTASLFQTQIRATALDRSGRPAILPRPTARGLDDEDGTNDLLYRNVREFAVGHGVSAEWDASQSGTVGWVATSWMPVSRVKGTTPKGHSFLDGIRRKKNSVLEAGRLAMVGDRENICLELREFCEAYRTWIDSDAKSLRARLGEFTDDLKPVAESIVARCEAALRRMLSGVEHLEVDRDAWTAFCLANAAMERQSRFPAKGERAGPLAWRPFQLAFMLLSVRSISVPDDPDRLTMDLLWFPTGGGKTEAYLALTAFQIFLRRLRVKERGERGGVDVLMRYTLRLLTVQQFQRAASLIAACELMRKEASGTLGEARITLGLFVGGDSTPNDLEGAAEKLEQERNGQRPRSTPRQLLKCPVCGGELRTTDYDVNVAASTMTIKCGAPGCETGSEPLPVMTVDEVIYLAPPSLLIGTVDKFAQLPRNTKIRAAFGLGTPVHPGLIIQDELHLISGPLGSMTGLYEAAIDYLCTDAQGVRPKIIGSTATIGRAARQVRALFDRAVMQFPPPGFDPGDSFFAVTDDLGPDRLYVGVSSAGRSPKFALQAVIAGALQIAGSLRDGGATDAAIDPYWTCVAYFNSLRELGGAHVMMMDDVPRQMAFLATRLAKPRRDLESIPRELSSRVPSSQIPETLISLEKGLGGDVFAAAPADTVLASNMISVGVDVPRLGLMVVNGQPKSTAEYIQATSRVGRGIPGLVLTLYNFGRPRDLSHLEHFKTYHASLYRGVEATSVTPWAPRARDKALHAILIAAVRHSVPEYIEDEDAVQFRGDHPRVQQIVDFLVSRARDGSRSLIGTDTESEETAAQLDSIVRYWDSRGSDARGARQRLRYWVKHAPFGRTAPHLMRAAEEVRAGDGSAWPTPNSMREVEPSTPFILKRIVRRPGGDNGRTD